ncbi:MAG TPA: hypothetical protein VI389_11470 [Geobacteraceae bacterium]
MADRSAVFRWVPALVLGMYLALFPDGTAVAAAGDPPQAEIGPPAPSPPSTEPTPGAAPPKEEPTGIEKSIDETHTLLEQSILEQAIRLDNFFGEVKADSQRRTSYELRLRTSVRVDDGGNLRFGASLRANAVLSRISNRLRLAISGDSEPEPFAPSLPEDPGNPGFDRTSQTTRIVNTELRYGLLQTPTMDLFAGAGFRLVLPPEAFLRTRFQYTHRFSDVTLMRVAETLYTKNTDALGETTEFAIERSLNPKTLLRWASTGTVSYELEGLEWGSEISLMRELSPKSAITVTTGVYGNTTHDDVITNYRLATRYRRNFLRKWLFYEIEPEVSWPRRGDGEFHTAFACTFLLEIVFQGSATDPEGTPPHP